MQLSASRPVRHDYPIAPADLGDAMALMMQRAEAITPAKRVKATRAWLHDGCAFGSLLYRNVAAGCTLLMFSDHPDFDDETFELDDSQAAEWIGETRHQVRAPTKDEAKAASFSTVELAAHWRCRRDTVDYMVEGGHLGAFRIGRFRYIRRAEVDRFERANSIRSILAEAAGDIGRTTLLLNAVTTRLRADARAHAHAAPATGP